MTDVQEQALRELEYIRRMTKDHNTVGHGINEAVYNAAGRAIAALSTPEQSADRPDDREMVTCVNCGLDADVKMPGTRAESAVQREPDGWVARHRESGSLLWHGGGVLLDEHVARREAREWAEYEALPVYIGTPPVSPQQQEPDARQAFLEAGWRFSHSIAGSGVCSDRSCFRCRLADLLFEAERLSESEPPREPAPQDTREAPASTEEATNGES